ncbi:cyanovirin-N-like protein [Tuber borchii]|uniref:Cyanovirin-N-like protein n=1 Tax=Tuber borchii TaxID=42251 RepID=A0A2T7A2U0_TUBBO|nr:cyanovirin-N-like protein [Tuber borchii]
MSYADSSRNAVLTNGGRTLRAECQNADGNWVTSEIDLDTCIGNPNGYLGWGMQNFSHSSEDIKLEEGGRKLTCRPKTVDGGFRERQGIDLNRIQNVNGRLVFQ